MLALRGADQGAGVKRLAVAIAIALAAAILAAGLSASDAAAQAKGGARKDRPSASFTWSNPIAITVLSVAAAPGTPQAMNGRLEIPIQIAWETGPWGDRVLLELEATLNVTDDKGEAVEVSKKLGVKDKQDTIALSLEEGRTPAQYVLTLVGRCRFTGEDGKVRVEPTIAQLAGSF